MTPVSAARNIHTGNAPLQRRYVVRLFLSSVSFLSLSRLFCLCCTVFAALPVTTKIDNFFKIAFRMSHHPNKLLLFIIA
jgi:hypothetical protein